MSRPSLLCAMLLAGACTAPRLQLDNPEAHPTFVDGRAVTAPVLPYRYYGTTRWNALPKDRNGEADWSLQPASQLVELPPPAPQLLFPLDLPLELLSWLWHGRRDVKATVQLPPTSSAQQAAVEQASAELGALQQRARAARSQR